MEAKSSTKTAELLLSNNPKLVISETKLTFTDRKTSTTFSANERVVIRVKKQVANYTVTVSSNNTTMGTVSGGGTYEEGKTVTVTATPKSGYRFVKWSDGTTANPYTFKATKDVTLTATFEKIPPTTYTITVKSSNTTMGTVSGGGTYEEGKTVTLTATPKSGYRFVKWSDGSTANPYTFKATKNVTLTASFEAITYDYTVKFVNAPKDAKVTIDGKSYADGAKFTTKKQLQASDVKATYAGYTTNVKIQNYVITVTYTKTTDGVESVAADDEAETAVNYDLTGRKVSQKTKVRGINLQKMNDGTTKKVLMR
ncbi:MAG: hypothetical protein MJZ54_05725 [Bacteroidaceae bacterium]|nr:hypothetical protein [Bacteroidaceae bacterium]